MWRRLDDYDQLLKEQFERASAKMDARIYHYLERLADENNLTITVKDLLNKKELAGFRLSVDEYIRLGQGVLDDATLQTLKNASQAVHISRMQALQTELEAISSQLCGETGRHAEQVLALELDSMQRRMLGDLAFLGKVPRSVARLNKGHIDRILRTPWAPDGKIFSSRIWENRNRLVVSLRYELAQNALSVQSLQQAAEHVSDAMDVSLSNARRVVRTEAAAMRSLGKKEMYERMGAKQYQISATLDGRTSTLCRSLDRKIYDTEAYETGVTAPPFHPWCRTTTVPRFPGEDAEVPRRRAARDPQTGKTYTESDIAYPQWHEKVGSPKATGYNRSTGTAVSNLSKKFYEELKKAQDAALSYGEQTGNENLLWLKRTAAKRILSSTEQTIKCASPRSFLSFYTTHRTGRCTVCITTREVLRFQMRI